MRLLLLAVLLWGFAGSPQRMEFAPIAGQVLDAVDDAPIAGATVAYRGAGGDLGDGKEINPPTLRGEVKTGADGRYTLPQLPPGSFRVKATMDGYFASGQTLQPPPMHDGKVIEFPGIELPNGVLRLRRDEVNLQAMSDDALKRFARHSVGYGFREVIGSQFSEDGRRLGFLTLESGSGDKSGWPIEWRCKVWAYDLKDGGLIGADLKAPVFMTRARHSLPGKNLHPADCDPAASDHTQPGQPGGALGGTPNDPSVCFVTLPGRR